LPTVRRISAIADAQDVRKRLICARFRKSLELKGGLVLFLLSESTQSIISRDDAIKWHMRTPADLLVPRDVDGLRSFQFNPFVRSH
jgi:hypothetical protein